jgi:hypothetical protein
MSVAEMEAGGVEAVTDCWRAGEFEDGGSAAGAVSGLLPMALRVTMLAPTAGSVTGVRVFQFSIQGSGMGNWVENYAAWLRERSRTNRTPPQKNWFAEQMAESGPERSVRK